VNKVEMGMVTRLYGAERQR